MEIMRWFSTSNGNNNQDNENNTTKEGATMDGGTGCNLKSNLLVIKWPFNPA
jgi:hypothetical protein